MSYKILKCNFVFMVVVFVVVCFIKLPNTKEVEELNSYMKEADITQLNDYLFIEEGCSIDEAYKAEEIINLLPSVFWKEFLENNGTINIVKELPVEGNVGKTIPEDDKVTIYIKDGYVHDCLAHEFFHFYLHKRPIRDKEFTRMYKAEGRSLIEAYYGKDSEYFYSNETEYLCQLFQTVLYKGGYNTENAPQESWNYMVDIITAMVNEDGGR